jgi:hypothetical protein
MCPESEDVLTDWDRLADAELTHDKPLADTELAHIGAHDAGNT